MCPPNQIYQLLRLASGNDRHRLLTRFVVWFISDRGDQMKFQIKHRFNSNVLFECELHLLSEWRTYDDDTINQMDTDALKFWRKYKAALLAMAEADGRGTEILDKAVND